MRDQFDSLRIGDLEARTGFKWSRYTANGSGILPAWVADMDYPIAEPIQRVVRRLVETSDLGYCEPPEIGNLPEIFGQRMEEQLGWTVEPGRIRFLVNALQGLDLSVMLSAGKGEGVVIQTPIYPPFLEAVSGTGRRLVESPLRRGPNRFEMDLDQLRATIDRDTRLFMLCNPHNPSGRSWTRSELEAVAELAIEHDLIVLADEIHNELVFPGHEHTVFETLGPEVRERTLTITSATKSFNLAGLELALLVFGSEKLKRRFDELPHFVLAHPGILGVEAARAAWRDGGPWLDEAVAYLDANRAFLTEFLNRRLPGIVHGPQEATYLYWLDCRDLDLPMPASRFFLKRAKVALNDGAEFGPPGSPLGFERCTRLNFATSQAILEEIVERMAAAVEAL
ncbi:MAG: aminotransferase class I/II-fold pyridoxal phosphate-dependent enzyme [Acidobacteria bacterium]|nr:aminotransferase class I/II-fold pyridoxal phosphate-dependent enzyme [Acidobacteriota bacterium]